MKKIHLLAYFLFSTFLLHSQNCSNKEIKIKYSDAIEVFHICDVNPQINFNNSLSYYWYTEFSKIKSTKGGSGGKLLNGNYKVYDDSGNLMIDENYLLGLKDGESKKWDEKGEIQEISKYKNGDRVYSKKFEDDGSVEHFGRMLSKGWIKKSYDKFGNLYAEQEQMDKSSNPLNNTKLYFENGNLKEEFTKRLVGPMVGEYTFYFKNGNKKVEGNFYDKELFKTMRTGKWICYNLDGAIDATEQYKVKKEKWANGNLKQISAYILDEQNNQWLRNGFMEEYSEDGKIQQITEYSWGSVKQDPVKYSE